MQAITTDGKRGHEFEGEPRQVSGWVWREEGEGRNVVIKTKPKK